MTSKAEGLSTGDRTPQFLDIAYSYSQGGVSFWKGAIAPSTLN